MTFLRGAAVFLAWTVLLAVPARAETSFTDLRGRTVTIEGPVSRIAIDDGRYLMALALIHPDPVSVLAGWPQDVHRVGRDFHDRLNARFPALAAVPKIGSSAGNFDLERLLSVAPEVMVFSLEAGPSAAQIAQIEAAGIKVVFIDFFSSPFENLAPSLTILGKLVGAEEKAAEFIAFRAEHTGRIAGAVARLSADQRPSVFLEAHAGISSDCCNSPGRGNVGDYIDFVGGHNIGADVIASSYGKLNLEYVIERDPDVYIATGGPHLEKAGGLVVGPGYDADRAESSLARMAARQGIASLSAVRARRVHGFSHQLINSPLDILAIEVFAKWIHSELFGEVDPQETLAEINRRFLAVPLAGTYWIDLR